MTFRVGFHPLASAEVIDAQLWYEDQVVVSEIVFSRLCEQRLSGL